jgi:hypothetical protein
VGIAPANVEDLPGRIGVGLAGRTIRSRDDGGVGEELAHSTMARLHFAIKIHCSRWGSRKRKSTAIVAEPSKGPED